MLRFMLRQVSYQIKYPYMSPIQIRYIPSTGNPEGKTTKDNFKVDHG